MKKFIVLLIISFLLIGCDTKAEKIKKLMKENEYTIIDVRTNEEYKEGHLVDSINIPYDEIEKIDLNKNQIIFVYCQSGNRSKIAYQTLVDLGYNVFDLGAFDKIDLPKE